MPVLLPLDNPFWQFSLRVYAVPEAAVECLALQRERSIDVNVLLFGCWIAVSRRVALDVVEIKSIENAVQGWHVSAVRPLREIRETLKRLPEMQHPEVQAFRQQVLGDELRAEQIEQALLFQYAEGLSVRDDTVPMRDLIAGNIDRLCSLAPVEMRAEPQISALIEASLAVGAEPSNPPG